MRLSICMMVKNEEMNLDRCLKSLANLRQSVDSELIIIDTGSTDNTMKIAKNYTDKLYFHAWNNSFADMRNITLSYATGEWVLIIDADEEIEDATNLIALLNSESLNTFFASSVTMKSIVDEKNSKINYVTSIRLFKNSNLKYEGSVHEHVNIKGKIIDSNTTFIHYGYKESNKELMNKKSERNINLLNLDINRDPENYSHRFYLCIEYYGLELYDKALEEAEKVYSQIKSGIVPPATALFMYSQIALCYLQKGNLEGAKQICYEGLQISDEQLDLHYCLGEIFFETNKHSLALDHYNKYLYYNENFKSLSIRLYTSCRFAMMNKQDSVYLKMAYIYLRQNQFNLAYEYAKKISYHEDWGTIFSVVIESLINSDQIDTLYQYYEQLVLKKDNDIQNVFFSMLEQAKAQLNNQITGKINTLFAHSTSQKTPIQTQNVNMELEQYKTQVKEIIHNLISVGKIEQAKLIIAEYLNIIKDDEEIIAIKKSVD